MRVFVVVADSSGVVQRTAPLQAVGFMELVEQELGKVDTVPPGDAGDVGALLLHGVDRKEKG